MKNKNLISLSFFFALASLAVIALSCNKKFDAPPTQVPVTLTPNITIQQLKAMHTSGNTEQITDDDIIGGVVVADDRSGNFYKQIIIQDASGGIALQLNGYDLYTVYPVGAQIYISAKGLYLGDYNGQIEIGGGVTSGSIDGIASQLFSKYIQVGTFGNAVTPHVVTVSELTTSLLDSFQSTLIELDGFQFAGTDTGKTYAIGGATPKSVGFYIQDCSSNKIELYNSGYANFAGVTVPSGNGNIVGIYAPYGSTKELLIRDTSDVKFTDSRCGGGGGGGNGSLTTIANILSQWNGSGIKIGSFKISGTVISDAASKNISSGAVVIEDGSMKGVEIYFGGTIGYNVGDSIVLDITGDSLIQYKGSFEIKTAYGASQPSPVATGKNVQPQIITISQLNADLASYEYALVQIQNATATTGTFSGSKTLTDATGSITLYTSSSATFAGSTIPTGTHSWTGYANFYSSTKEFQIRNTNDVQ